MFLLVSTSVRSKQLLCSLHRQGQKNERKPTTKNFVAFHNHSPLLTMLQFCKTFYDHLCKDRRPCLQGNKSYPSVGKRVGSTQHSLIPILYTIFDKKGKPFIRTFHRKWYPFQIPYKMSWWNLSIQEGSTRKFLSPKNVRGINSKATRLKRLLWREYFETPFYKS